MLPPPSLSVGIDTVKVMYDTGTTAGAVGLAVLVLSRQGGSEVAHAGGTQRKCPARETTYAGSDAPAVEAYPMSLWTAPNEPWTTRAEIGCPSDHARGARVELEVET